MNNIDELYDIIINSNNHEQTWKENLNLWKEFYDNRNTLIRYNATNPKIFTIIKFLLEQEKGQIFKYFESDILDVLIFAQKMICFNLRKKENPTLNDIQILLNNYENFESMSTFLKQTPPSQDNINQNSREKYQNSSIKLDTIEALTLTVYNNFFNIPPNIVHKIINYIEKDVTKVASRKTINNKTYINLVYQYLEKIIPIKYFTGMDIENDTLINEILAGNLQDKSIVKQIFKYLKIDTLMEIFKYDIENFLTFLDKLDKLDDVYKQTLMDNLADTLLKDDNCIYLFPLIMNECNNKYWKNYLTEDIRKKLINRILSCTIYNLDTEIINYLLDTNQINELFLYNLTELLHNNNNFLSKEEKQSIKQKLEKIQNTIILDQNTPDFNTSIQTIKSYLDKKISLKVEDMILIIKSIIKNMLESIDIHNVEVYLENKITENGCYYSFQESNCIEINIFLLNKFLNTKFSLATRMEFLKTSLHEMRHAVQNKNKKEQKYDINTYKMVKEDNLKKFDPNYYSSNYKYVNEEIDARIESYNMLAKFFETYLPEYLDELQKSIIENLQKEQTIKNTRDENEQIQIISKANIDFNLAFDTLIKYNPNILKEAPILNIEYYEDGSPKSYEDIVSLINDENKELINYILETRYPSYYTQRRTK